MPTQIDKRGVFLRALPSLPPLTTRFDSLLQNLDGVAIQMHGGVSTGSLSNCHGDWFEWLLAIVGWNVSLSSGKSFVPFMIPNVKQFDSLSLYNDQLFSMVQHLRQQVRHATVELITSNPDFVVARRAVANGLPISGPISAITPSLLDALKSIYRDFVGRCDYGDICSYASAKTSLRPDRRLQIPHEGSLVKALHVHLQTRLWITNPPVLKYYAITARAGEADRSALRTVATHSITTVTSTPQAAVDDVFAVATLQEAWDAFDQILS